MTISLAAQNWTITVYSGALNSRDPDGDGVNNGIDATAPTLSAITHTVTGSTTADVGATSSEDGSLYAVVVASGASAPDGTQVVAGTDGTDSTAVDAANKPCTASVAETLSMSGLSASTAYDYYVTAKDLAGNIQFVPLSGSFTTDASGTVETANILWNGDFENGDFLQYPKLSDATRPEFHPIWDAYEPPAAFGGVGDGSECNLVTTGGSGSTDVGPVRTGTYSCKFGHPVSGGSPADPQGSNDTNRRRSEIHTLWASANHEMVTYYQTSWVALSVYLDSNWDTATHDGWGIIVFQIKPRSDANTSFELLARNGSWEIKQKWYTSDDALQGDIPWWYTQRYSGSVPSSGGSYEDLLSDMPSASASKSALADLNRGGWTDWIIKATPDPRTAGNGKLDVWKRNSGGSWTHIIDVSPRQVTVGSHTYDRGVFTPTAYGYYYTRQGLYSSATQITQASADRLLYHGGTRFYDGASTFNGIVTDMWGG